MHHHHRPNHADRRSTSRRQKKLQASEVLEEQFRETQAFLRLARESFARQGVSNLEAIELGLREALLKDGCRLLEGLFDSSSLNIPDNTGRPGEKCHPNRALK